MNSTGNDLYIYSIMTCGVLDFLEELRLVYSELVNLSFMRKELLDSSLEPDLNALIRSIISKLE